MMALRFGEVTMPSSGFMLSLALGVLIRRVKHAQQHT
jgi:hypothetical protein